MIDPRIQADIDEAAASFGMEWRDGQLVRKSPEWTSRVESSMRKQEGNPAHAEDDNR